MSYTKIRFTSSRGSTPGLVFDTEQAKAMTIGDISRRFGYGDAMKMTHIDRSPAYPTWDQAFNHQFEETTP